MKLTTAIKIITSIMLTCHYDQSPDDKLALMLTKEALERQAWRHYLTFNGMIAPLPTEEEEVKNVGTH